MRSIVPVALFSSSVLLLGSGLVSVADAASAPAYGVTWTADPAGNAVVEYAAHATGAATPIATISGAGTGLDQPSGVALDNSGNVFVANSGNNSITEYAAGATGAATPIETITGANTALTAPSSIMFIDGQVWVTDPATNLVEAFTAGSGGNVLPAETISGAKTRLNNPVAVTVSKEDGGVWVANHPATGLPSVDHFSEVGDVAPDLRVRGDKTGLQSPVALLPAPDDFFSVLVADSATNTISEFDPLFSYPAQNQAPARRIRGAATGLAQPDGLTIDAVGRLFVANAGNHSLEVFAANASGNAKPQRSLTGVGGTNGPAGVAVSAAAPSAPRHVHVHAHNGSARLTWDPPVDSGGGIVAYDAVAVPMPKHPTSGVFESFGSDHQTKKTSIVMRHLTNGVTYEFLVVAYNAIGSGVSRSFPRATPYGPPKAPRGVTAVTGSRSLKVFWAAPTLNGGKRINYYRVQYAPCGFSAPGCKTKTRNVGGGKRHVKLTGLTSGVRYHVRVFAHNAKGTSPPSTATIGRPA